MKRLITLALALCMACGLTAFGSGAASALEVQISGVWDTNFRFDDNLGFDKNDERDHFIARSRFRPQVEFIASENLRGVIQFQIGSIVWGDALSGGQLDTNRSSATTRRAYIDWTVANTTLNFKFGLHHIGLPSAVRGNPFFSGNVAGITGTVGFTDEVSLSAFWARPYVAYFPEATDYKYNQSDLFGLVLDLNFDNFSLSPWFVYANIGNASDYWNYLNSYSGNWRSWFPAFTSNHDHTDVLAGGLALKVMPTDSLSIGFDAAYSTADNGARKGANRSMEGDGYFLALTVDYAMDWGTPGAFAWYSSGDSKSDRKNLKWGRMMSLGMDDGVAFTRMGFMGSYGHGLDTVVSAVGAGTWGVGLQLADISFVEKLSHTIRVAYYEGTNDKFGEISPWGDDHLPAVLFGEVVYMTEKDWALEVNFDHQYQITDNLTAVLELGWIHMNLDSSNVEYLVREGEIDKNAYNAQVIMRYSF